MYQPNRLYVEQSALSRPMTQRIISRLPDVPVEVLEESGRIPVAPKGSPGLVYAQAKRIMIVGSHPDRPFRTCKPSADYELPLGISCPGLCQYCYLQGSLGARPYVRVYADLEALFAECVRLSDAAGGGEITFEAASTSDPMAVEHLTGAVAEAIGFFAMQHKARLRLVTKYAYTEGLLALGHAGHTQIRFSLNTDYIVNSFEAGTDPVPARIHAANCLGLAGYPIGFVLAPLLLYQGWEHDYDAMLEQLAQALEPRLHEGLSFELISHRFTARAKELIQSRFPQCRLDLDETRRRVKWGRYGHRKFVYPAGELKELWRRLHQGIARRFPSARIVYQV